MLYFSVLKVISLKSRCQQGHTSSDGSRGESLPASSSFWCLLPILGISWPIDSSLESDGCLLPVYLHVIIFCVCLFLFPKLPLSSEHQSYQMQAQPDDLLLPNYISISPISKLGHILKYWRLGFKPIFQGGHNSTLTYGYINIK